MTWAPDEIAGTAPAPARAATTTPPPPTYAPSVGLNTTWWSQTAAAVWTPERMAAADAAQQRLTQSMDDLSRSITETPEERRRRQRDEDDAAHAAAGETPRQRAQRHRREERKAQRAASRLWKVGADDRARRFRRWCTLTALSASAGYAVGLVQWATTLPYGVAVLALAGTYWFDVRMRGGWFGAARLSDLRGWRPISAVVLARIPVGSALAACLHLQRLFALSGELFHLHH